MKRVCVVGAGPVGLCAVKHLKQNGFDVVCFEKQAGPGGVWRYTKKQGSVQNRNPDDLLPASAIYRDMRVNIAHPFWKLDDFDFDVLLPGDKSSFPHWSRILEFFQEYCKTFGLEEFIRYNTLVQNITPTDPSAPNSTKWVINFKNLKTQENLTLEFDAVMIVNGKEWYTDIPKDLLGLADFPGRLLHSADFDSAEDFSRDERVLIVGSSASAMELVEVLHNRCKEVLWSHHAFFVNAENCENLYPPNVKHLSDIDCIKGSLVHFKPGAWNSPQVPEKVDTIIMATGFDVDGLRKMIDPSVKLDQINKTFEPLHRQLVHMDFNTLCFPFQHTYSIFMTSAEHQVKYYVQWLLGNFELPSRPEMLKIREEELDTIEKCMGTRDPKFLRFHCLPGDPNRVSNYLNGLSQEAGMPKVPAVFQENFNDLYDKFFTCPMTYKKHYYKVKENGRFEIYKNGK